MQNQGFPSICCVLIKNNTFVPPPGRTAFSLNSPLPTCGSMFGIAQNIRWNLHAELPNPVARTCSPNMPIEPFVTLSNMSVGRFWESKSFNGRGSSHPNSLRCFSGGYDASHPGPPSQFMESALTTMACALSASVGKLLMTTKLSPTLDCAHSVCHINAPSFGDFVKDNEIISQEHPLGGF